MTALMTMAATARPPGLGDARVPCPLCGGLIHPVAGRCKHCKEDLSQFRAGRPQAAATLPSLNGNAITAPSTLHPPSPVVTQTNGYAPPTQTGTNGQTPMAAPIAIQAREGSQPILPPRQTGSWRAKETQSSSLLRSWPIIVIGVAVLAIVTAVVIMVLPQDKKSSGKKIGAPPPAPERMDVDPTNPKSSQLNPPKQDDPWANDDQSTPPAPHMQPVQPPMTPDPLNPDPNADPNDILGQLGNGMSGGMGTGGGSVMLAAFDKICTKLKSCNDTDPSVSMICDQFSAVKQVMPQLPTGCAAAQKCLQQIDNFSCSNDAVNVMTALYAIPDCKDAITGC